MKFVIVAKGGSGSGFHGHAGRPGKVGGSTSGHVSQLEDLSFLYTISVKVPGINNSTMTALWEAWNDVGTRPSTQAVALMKAAAEEFRVTYSTNMNKVYPNGMPGNMSHNQLKSALRSLYNTTQKVLDEHNITHIKLYRGAASDKVSTLSSWTANVKEAQSYAEFVGGKVYEKIVPAKAVLSIGGVTGFGDSFLNEYVVLDVENTTL